MYLFVPLFDNLQFVSYYFSALIIFQDFSLNFAKTLGRAVDKFLNGSRVISHGQFIFGKQARVCFEATRLSRKTEGVTLPFSRHGRNWHGLFFTFYFCKSELLTMKTAS